LTVFDADFDFSVVDAIRHFAVDCLALERPADVIQILDRVALHALLFAAVLARLLALPTKLAGIASLEFIGRASKYVLFYRNGALGRVCSYLFHVIACDSVARKRLFREMAFLDVLLSVCTRFLPSPRPRTAAQAPPGVPRRPRAVLPRPHIPAVSDRS
jgi:hypothetical protein